MYQNFNLPAKAFLNKFIPKSKFYEKAMISTKARNGFIRKIQKITWKYKLAESTIGINKTEEISEIQIFELELKEKKVPLSLLKIIDMAIPYKIFYVFTFNSDFAYGISLKDESYKYKYYISEWNEDMLFDFSGIDLEKVYNKLVIAFIKNKMEGTHEFKETIKYDNTITYLETEIDKLRRKIRKEKQFNRKVDLNKILIAKEEFLLELKGDI